MTYSIVFHLYQEWIKSTVLIKHMFRILFFSQLILRELINYKKLYYI